MKECHRVSIRLAGICCQLHSASWDATLLGRQKGLWGIKGSWRGRITWQISLYNSTAYPEPQRQPRRGCDGCAGKPCGEIAVQCTAISRINLFSVGLARSVARSVTAVVINASLNPLPLALFSELLMCRQLRPLAQSPGVRHQILSSRNAHARSPLLEIRTFPSPKKSGKCSKASTKSWTKIYSKNAASVKREVVQYGHKQRHMC
jgi:hypothetical protein